MDVYVIIRSELCNAVMPTILWIDSIYGVYTDEAEAQAICRRTSEYIRYTYTRMLLIEGRQ